MKILLALLLIFAFNSNISKAKQHSVYVDGFCTEIAKSMNLLIIDITTIHKENTSTYGLMYDGSYFSKGEFMILHENRLMDLKRLYDEFCDPKYFKADNLQY
jgi:hypothetical protein